ncbi:hypothetical protein N9Y92_00935 [Chlamydiales bacterium]|nr:hypothetical protein [Chlamydiales bacterium]
MKRPLGLPDNLVTAVEHAHQGEELFYQIIQLRMELIIEFFEAALDDETWIEDEGGKSCLKLLIKWLTDEFKVGAIPWPFARRIAKIMQRDHDHLHEFYVNDILFNIQGVEFKVNSLLLKVYGGNYFINLMEHQKNGAITFKKVSPKVFAYVREFINTGRCLDLWKEDSDQILKVIEQANLWRLTDLSDFAFDSYKNYLSKDSINQRLIYSLENKFERLTFEMMGLLNQEKLGFYLSSLGIGNYELELIKVHEEDECLVREFIPWITYFECHNLKDNKELICSLEPLYKALKILNISRNSTDEDLLFTFPKDLEEINLSDCPFVTDKLIERLCKTFKKLKFLNITKCHHVTYVSLAELHLLKELDRLDLSFHVELRDDDISILADAVPNIMELTLVFCKKLTNDALYTIATKFPNLRYIDLSLCEGINEEGLMYLKGSKKLQGVTLKGINWMDERVSQMMKRGSPTLSEIVF